MVSLAGSPRIAIVHDWLNGMRGGESVLEAIVELFPESTLFTLIREPDQISPLLRSLQSETSWIQNWEWGKKNYRKLLPLFPLTARQFDLSSYDLVISSSHCIAKGVKKRRNAVHLSYVHAPMRYIWDRFGDYFGPNASFSTRIVGNLIRTPLQNWDRQVSQSDRVDVMIANSHYIASRIQAHYGRSAEVIHPFVQFERFQQERKPEDFYLMLGALAPNKRVDLAIEAFNENGKSLWIAGTGQEEERLKSLAKDNIRFLGAPTNDEVASLYSRCKAFLFPGVEDFGITPLEAMAAGAPVIAFAQAGALETVTEKTGVFFHEPTEESLNEAVQKLETGPSILESDCRGRAQSFSRTGFQEKFSQAVQSAWANRV